MSRPKPADEDQSWTNEPRRIEMDGARPQCPTCDGIELRRQGRVGFWQRRILSRFGYFPWECGQCREIYMLKQRALGYRQHSHDGVRTPTKLSGLVSEL